MAEKLRQESNAKDGVLFFAQRADTMEVLEKALRDTDYQGECMHCMNRGYTDSIACMACDMDNCKCDHPCPCWDCKGGSNWEWRSES